MSFFFVGTGAAFVVKITDYSVQITVGDFFAVNDGLVQMCIYLCYWFGCRLAYLVFAESILNK